MRIISAVIIGVIVVLVQAVALSVSRPPLEHYLQDSILESSTIVVGHIGRNLPFDETVPTRTSVLVVTESLFGNPAGGDSLVVTWEANRWRPNDEIISEVACGGELQLNTVVGMELLWVLHDYRGLRCRIPPLDFCGMPSEELERMAEIVTTPDTSSALKSRLYRAKSKHETGRQELKKAEVFSGFLLGVVNGRDGQKNRSK